MQALQAEQVHFRARGQKEHKEEKINKTRVKLIRTGPTIKVEGKEQKQEA